MRYWLRDTSGAEAMMDWPLADAGAFNAITSTWVHIVLTVTPTSIMTYQDGTRVDESQYGYYGAFYYENVCAFLNAKQVFDRNAGGRSERGGAIAASAYSTVRKRRRHAGHLPVW